MLAELQLGVEGEVAGGAVELAGGGAVGGEGCGTGWRGRGWSARRPRPTPPHSSLVTLASQVDVQLRLGGGGHPAQPAAEPCPPPHLTIIFTRLATRLPRPGLGRARGALRRLPLPPAPPAVQESK